ncbi:hypothetical protein [Spirillospora sp. CA-128828]|uniref:hypothetical protein n=1 Tax=Spirillospora sp. CA-128828 TaxID=3240033 RepID=UPI003D8E96FF
MTAQEPGIAVTVLAGIVFAECPVDRLPCVRQDIDHQEQQDPDRDRAEQRAHPRPRITQAPERQPEKDREAGDGPEQGDLLA